MKKLSFLTLAIFFSHNIFAEQNLGPVGKFPESSRVEFKEFTPSSMRETLVRFSNNKSQTELDQIAEKYSLRVFSSAQKNQAVVAGYFSNILALAGNDDVTLMEQGHFIRTDRSRRYRVDYSGLNSSKPVSSFNEIPSQVRTEQTDDYKIFVQHKSFSGEAYNIGEIRFINPLVSVRVGNACSFTVSGERPQSRVIEATTMDNTGALSYHYIYARFAYSATLYELRNLPLINDVDSARSCIPQQTYTAAEIGLPPVSGL